MRYAHQEFLSKKLDTYTIIHQWLGKSSFINEYGEPVDIFDNDWDNLIILDGCRFDTFQRINYLHGNLDEVVSMGSTSREFCEKNFRGRELYDTVYVTANTEGYRFGSDTFHHVHVTFSEDYTYDEKYKNYGPKSVYESAIDTYERFENKRLIVQFMQPHEPYFGEKAREIRSELNKQGIYFYTWDPEMRNDETKESYKSLIGAAKAGHITDEDLHQIYEENLEIVLQYVEKLLEKLNGKSVITSDHGELLGNPTGTFTPIQYRHRAGVYNPELRLVPWLEIENENRRHIIPEQPVDSPEVSEEAFEEQLRALGYKE